VHVSTNTVSSRGCRELVTALSPPFYCPRDRGGTIYVPEGATRDIVFEDKPNRQLRDWRERDFAFAYVVAHEWGHHAQAVLGYLSPRRLSIRIELQADCFAGLWAHETWADKLLEPGDIREAVKVTHFVGEPSGARPTSPDAHGTSAQRKEWFLRGYRSGSFERCDTSTVPTRG
jgi:predicted metalloprotease